MALEPGEIDAGGRPARGDRFQAIRLTKKPAQFTMRVCAGHEPQLTAKASSRRHPIDAKLYDPEILVGINGPEDVEE